MAMIEATANTACRYYLTLGTHLNIQPNSHNGSSH